MWFSLLSCNGFVCGICQPRRSMRKRSVQGSVRSDERIPNDTCFNPVGKIQWWFLRHQIKIENRSKMSLKQGLNYYLCLDHLLHRSWHCFVRRPSNSETIWQFSFPEDVTLTHSDPKHRANLNPIEASNWTASDADTDGTMSWCRSPSFSHTSHPVLCALFLTVFLSPK